MKRLAILLLSTASATAADLVPIGPELAPPEVGVLVKAYPIAANTNPGSPYGVGVYLWGCDYRVGKALITVTITTQPSDPMPCKRKVKFGKPD